MGWAKKKKVYASMTVPPASVRVPIPRSFVSNVTTVLSVSTDILAFNLCLRKTPARRLSDEDCAATYHLKWVPLLPNEVAQHMGREKDHKVSNDVI